MYKNRCMSDLFEIIIYIFHIILYLYFSIIILEMSGCTLYISILPIAIGEPNK